MLVDRQLLGPAGRSNRSISDVASALALLHATDPSTPYLSVHVRTDSTIADIDDALYEARTLSRCTTVRRTVFVMDREAADAACGAFNVALADKLRRQLIAWLDASDDVDGPGDRFLADVEQAVVDSLRSGGRATGAQLSTRVPMLRAQIDPQPGAAYSKPIRVTSKVLELLGVERRIVRGRPTGTDLTSGAWTWEAAEARSSERAPERQPDVALVALLDRYLMSFGPATVTDMTWWTGLTKTKIRAALRSLDAIEVELEDSTEHGYVRPDDTVQSSTMSTPVVALLPGLDSTTMGWKQRSWYVDDTIERGLFDKNGNAGPTVWLDGAVIGAWTQRSDGSVVVDLQGNHGDEVHAMVASEAQRLQSWLGEIRVRWRYPTPVTRALDA